MRGLTSSTVLTLALVASVSVAEAALPSETAEARGASPKVEALAPNQLQFVCNRQNKLGAFLAQLDPGVPHTVRVVGACRENLVLSGFARLILIAAPGASISDASGGVDFAVQTAKFATVELQGFRINGSVGCFEGSTCSFITVTFQNGDGVQIIRSYADLLTECIIQNSTGGLFVANGSVVRTDRLTVRNTGGEGIRVVGGAHATVFSSTIENNAGSGIVGRVQASIRVFDGTIRGNGGDGITVDSGSNLQVANEIGTSITGNALAGVSVGDLTYAELTEGTTVTGNLGGTDVLCLPQFSATRGALDVGGSTNCVEP